MARRDGSTPRKSSRGKTTESKPKRRKASTSKRSTPASNRRKASTSKRSTPASNRRKASTLKRSTPASNRRKASTLKRSTAMSTGGASTSHAPSAPSVPESTDRPGAHVARLFAAVSSGAVDNGLANLLATIPQRDGHPTLAELEAVSSLAACIEHALAHGAPPRVWSEFERAHRILMRTDSETSTIVEYVEAFERAVEHWHLRPAERLTIVDVLMFEISLLDPRLTYRDPRLTRHLQEQLGSTIRPGDNRQKTRGGQLTSAVRLAAEVAVEWKALNAGGKDYEKAKRAFVERVRRARERGR